MDVKIALASSVDALLELSVILSIVIFTALNKCENFTLELEIISVSLVIQAEKRNKGSFTIATEHHYQLFLRNKLNKLTYELQVLITGPLYYD